MKLTELVATNLNRSLEPLTDVKLDEVSIQHKEKVSVKVQIISHSFKY